MGRLILAQLPLVGNADCLATPRGSAAATAATGATDTRVVVVSRDDDATVARTTRRRSCRQVEERRSQADGQVGRRHLIDGRKGSDISQETEEGLESLTVFVW